MLISRLTDVVKNITLEPVMFFYFSALALSSLGVQNLLLQKVCFNGPSAPPVGHTECPDEESAQKEVTQIQTWRELIILVGPAVFVLFAGSWSDNHGKRRKPLMYLPLCGQIVSDLLSIVNVFFWKWSAPTAALLTSLPQAMTGWRSCFIIGAMSYMSDSTTEKDRTVRIGVIVAVFFLGSPLAAILFGLVFNHVGLYGVFLICASWNALAVMYLFLFISENNEVYEKGESKPKQSATGISNAIESFKVVFKQREDYRRAVLILAVVIAPLTMAPWQGEYAVLYFFVRYQFHWGAAAYGYYAAYKLLVVFFGTCITMGIFSHLLKFSDTTIGIMSSITLIIAALGNAFADKIWKLLFFPVIDFMHGAGTSVVYAIISKIVDPTELGQANSVVGVLDSLFPLVNMPLYFQFYNHTFSHLPGAFFLLSVGYGILILTIYVAMHILHKRKKIEVPKTDASY